MALRWIEGFDAHTTQWEIYDRLYESITGDPDPVDFTQQDGAEVDADEGVASDENVITTNALVGSNQNTWILQFAFRPDDTAEIDDGTDFSFVSLRNSDGEQVRIEFVDVAGATVRAQANNFYKLRIMRGATEIASSNEKWVVDTFVTEDTRWQYFQMKITIDNSAGSVEVREQWMRKPSRNPAVGYRTVTWDAAVTSVDTQEQTSTGADRLSISFDTGDASDAVAFDDFIAMDSTGSKNNDFLGRVVIQRQLMSTSGGGDGDTVDWTLATATTTEDAFQETSHTVVNDDKRLTSDTVAQIHLGQMDSLPPHISAAPIIGVRMDLHGKMETSGSLSIGFMWRKTTATAAQIEFGTALTVSSTTPVGAAVIAEDDPNTLTDWVNADMDVMQLGCKNNG
jgi:hypothetical protein